MFLFDNDVQTGTAERSFENIGRLLMVLTNGTDFVSSSKGIVVLRDVSTLTSKAQFQTTNGINGNLEEDTRGVAVTMAGTTLAVASSPSQGETGGSITVWNIPTGQIINEFPDAFRILVLSPDGRRLAGGGGQGIVKIWSTLTNSEPQVLQAHDATIRALAFSPDSQVLATGGSDQLIRLWDATTGTNLVTLFGHEDGIRQGNENTP